MAETYKRGDRVKHTTKTDWGLGEILDDEFGGKVQIIFEDVGVKKFALEKTPLTRVSGDEARSSYLDSLVRAHARKPGKKATAASMPFVSFSKAVQSFLRVFPGGFQDPQYLAGEKSEREYKLKAHEYLRDHIGPAQMGVLIESQHFSEICDHAKRIINQTNLIHHYEKLWLNNALSSDARRQLFASELANLLYGDKLLSQRFESFVKMLYDIGAAKWTIATYFLFLGFPNNQIFVKPEVTKHAARVLGLEIDYQPDVNWSTYERVLEFAGVLKDKLGSQKPDTLVPKDMIDVQSFIWVIGPAYSA